MVETFIKVTSYISCSEPTWERRGTLYMYADIGAYSPEECDTSCVGPRNGCRYTQDYTT